MRGSFQSSCGHGPDQGGVVAWRAERLAAAGFAPHLAGALAGDSEIDLHALIELVERGCAPALAARILASLDAPVKRIT